MVTKNVLPGGLGAKHLKVIARLRDSVEPSDAYNSYCWDVSDLVAAYLQKEGLEVELCDNAGAVRDHSHVYVLLGDGTIIDPTLDQFYRGGRGNTTGDWTDPIWDQRDKQEYGTADLPNDNLWFGKIAVIPFDHPFAQHYWSHRHPAWTQGKVGWEYWRQAPEWYRVLHGLKSPSVLD